MGVLNKQSTLTIAVWASVLIHTAGFLGFELVFSNRKESFPKSEPRTVTIVSINSVTSSPFSSLPVEENSIKNQVLEKNSIQEPVLEKKELAIEIIQEITSSELVPDIGSTNKQEDKTLFSDNSVSSYGSGVVEEAILKTEPVPLNNIEPEYSFRARKKGLEGIVIMDVVISILGQPVSCIITDSSGYKDLDDAAKKTVLSSQFYPGTLNGEDIESTLRISIRFQLNKS
ncbi:MAG: TonB family protein [Spirochaetales bacterium]|nr:TonB family protein [Spirochaetales bacterium]